MKGGAGLHFSLSLEGNLWELMNDEILAGERAVSTSVRAAGVALKANWRSQVVGAGLGVRLSNAIRADIYPAAQPSLNAAALVYSKAPKIIAAHEEGAIIHANGGFWLAIPTPEAGRAPQGARWTPANWQFTRGKVLRFVPTRHGALLVADDYRVNTRGRAVRNRRKRQREGVPTVVQAVPIFVLVPQVRLRKRLNLYSEAERIAATIPGSIVANWRS